MNISRFSFVRRVAVALLFVGVATSCTDPAVEEADEIDYNELEQEVLDLWMAENMPASLVNSRQDDGYYIEFDASATPTGDAVMQGSYVKYLVTTSDLSGNVCNTRNETMAIQQWTYNRYARYVAMTDYIPSVSDGYEDDDDDDDYDYEVIELALMSNEMVIDGIVTSVEFKAGSKFTLYYPSAIAGSPNGSGGFAGQYVHSGYTPLKSEIEITEVMQYPSLNEKALIDEFVAANSSLYPTTDWELLNDEGAHYIRLNKNYVPSDVDSFVYIDEYPYTKLMRDYAERDDKPHTVLELNQMIGETWHDLYEEDKSSSDIGIDGSCYVRYVVRTLDGFVIDTNVEDIQWLIYDAASSSTAYITYNAEDDEDSYITAWYYVIPKLKYGQWAAFLTTSTNAYEDYGTTAGSSSSEIGPYTPLLFEVYIWPSSDEDEEDDVLEDL